MTGGGRDEARKGDNRKKERRKEGNADVKKGRQNERIKDNKKKAKLQ